MTSRTPSACLSVIRSRDIWGPTPDLSFVHLLCSSFQVLFWNDLVACYPARQAREEETGSQQPPHLCGTLGVRRAGRQEVTAAEAGLAGGPAPGTHPVSAWASFQAISFPEPLSHTRDLCSQGEVTGTLGFWELGSTAAPVRHLASIPCNPSCENPAALLWALPS